MVSWIVAVGLCVLAVVGFLALLIKGLRYLGLYQTRCTSGSHAFEKWQVAERDSYQLRTCGTCGYAQKREL